MPAGRIQYAVSHRELDCKRRTTRLLSALYFSRSGVELRRITAENASRPVRVVRGTVGAFVLDTFWEPAEAPDL